MFDLTLTFDNGPDPDVTPHVLDVLARRGIKASFFLVGQQLDNPRCRDLAIRAHGEGHWIGNHSFTHAVPLGEMPEADAAESEIGRTEAAIGTLASAERWFRPFGGGGFLDSRLLKSSVVEYLVRHDYSCVLWNSVPRDWEHPLEWIDRALEQCGEQAWTCMVLHDLKTGAMDNLDLFLDRAEDAGARFRQDFPPDCVPIRAGKVVRPISAYVSTLEDIAA